MTRVHLNPPRLFLHLATMVILLSLARGTHSATAQEPLPANAKKSNESADARRRNRPPQSVSNAWKQGYLVPEEVDRNDPKQRFLLLTPGGPLLVELRLMIDGRPFSAPREEMIDAIIKQTGKPHDREVSWEEIFHQPRLAAGRFYRLRATPSALKSTISTYDINGNGVAERYELRLFLALTYNGASFGIMPASSVFGVTNTTLFEKLDQDSDGLLSDAELAAIQDSLKHHDIGDNEIIEAAELAPAQMINRRASETARNSQTAGILLAIGPGANSDLIRKTILARFGSDETLSAEMIPQSTALVKHLDRNSNRLIDDDEWTRLSDAPPQITLEVNLGPDEGVANGMKLLALAKELGPVEKVATFQRKNKLVLVLDSCHLELFCSEMVPTRDYEQYAQSMINNLDKDKNGYLEMSELEPMGQGYAAQFEIWDADQDGKVYSAEIRSAYDEMQRPMWDRVLIGGVDNGSSLFEQLDINGDSRLPLRELQQAEQRLRALDQNENGQVESDEVPIILRVGIGRGTTVYQLLSTGTAINSGGFTAIGGARATNKTSPPAEPRWFSGMDRNGDDDLSPREFLGTAAQFADLDADGDGLMSREEALEKKP